MKLRESLSTALVSVAVLCAVVVTVATVRREFFPASGNRTEEPKPVPVANWKEFAVGHRFGPADAPVTIIEFADFECPVCRTFTLGPLQAIRNKYPTQVAVVFRHWPLTYHRFAYASARAAECAGLQGKFEQFHDIAYLKQDSIGLKPFVDYARDIGVPDLPAFNRCNTAASPLPIIEADKVAATNAGGRGTPTIIINGLRLPGAPDSARLGQFVRAALLASHAGPS